MNFLKYPLLEATEEGSTGSGAGGENPEKTESKAVDFNEILSPLGIQTENLSADNFLDSLMGSPVIQNQIKESNQGAKEQAHNEFLELAKPMFGISNDAEIRNLDDLTSQARTVMQAQAKMKDSDLHNANREQAKTIQDLTSKLEEVSKIPDTLKSEFEQQREADLAKWKFDLQIKTSLQRIPNTGKTLETDVALDMYATQFPVYLEKQGLRLEDSKIVHTKDKKDGSIPVYKDMPYRIKKGMETIDASLDDVVFEFLNSMNIIVENTAVSTGTPEKITEQPMAKRELPLHVRQAISARQN